MGNLLEEGSGDGNGNGQNPSGNLNPPAAQGNSTPPPPAGNEDDDDPYSGLSAKELRTFAARH